MRSRTTGVTAGTAAWVGMSLALAGCGQAPEADVAERTSAIVSTAGLQLKVQTATCVANQAQDYFQITNTGSTAVKLSDLKVKYWVDDTTGQFNIAHDSPDDKMIALAVKSLAFVAEIRPGDNVPNEILTGKASWSIDPKHTEVARRRIAAFDRIGRMPHARTR